MSARKVTISREERELQRAAAYERGWVDSLRGYQNGAAQPWEDKYDYQRGWWACADYRWADPSNNGVAPDPNFRS